jgi:glycosyltransferase involved in cell wall biosynthesis
LIFDDCSRDATPKIADGLSRKNRKIKVIHNKKNRGWGYNYREGINLAKKKYFMYLAGDAIKEPIEPIIKNTGKSDMIIPYVENKKDRPFFRNFVSSAYVTTINILFGLRIRYYNGFAITRTADIKKLKLSTNSFALQTEVIVKLARKGCKYLQVPYITHPADETSVFRIRNILGVLKAITKLFIEVNIRKKY